MKIEKSNEEVSEENVEYFIESMIKKYFEIHRLVDAMVWRKAISLIVSKYDLEESWKKNIKLQGKKYGELT